MPEVRTYIRKPETIYYECEYNVEQGERKLKETCPEAPLESMNHALKCLEDVVASVMELPLSWLNTVTINGFRVSATPAGTRSMQILYTKGLLIDKTIAQKTPLFQIDPPAEGEKEERAVATDEAVICVNAIVEAEKYIDGERQQMSLDGIAHSTTKADDDQDEFGLDEEEVAE